MAATGAFAFGCLERAAFAPSAAAYAAGADAIGQQAKAQTPQVASLPFSIAGVNGDTCRVTYHGVHAGELWQALSDFSKNRMNGDCTQPPATATLATLRCAANKGNPAYAERVERQGNSLTIDLTWLGPRLP